MLLVALLILLVAGIGLGIVTAINTVKPRFAHQMGALGLLLVIYVIVAGIVLRHLARRTGFYAKPGEVGILEFNGSLRRPAHPVTHFVRITAVNKFGIGKLRSMPVIYGMNDSGQRVVALSELMNERHEIDAFIKVSELPIEGEASERIGVVGVVRRFPMAPEMRSQLRTGFLVSVPFFLLMIAGLLLIFFAVH
jgi:hypothetical protein